jgi:hypothetical protein
MHTFRRGLQCASFAAVSVLAAFAQTPGKPPGEKVTVYPNQKDPCVIPEVLAESRFAISCQSSPAELLQRLHSPDACGKNAKHKAGDACAVLMYVIDDYSSAKEYGLLPTWTVRIGKISHPDNAAETTVTVLKSNSSEERLGPERVYELLLPIRLNNKVTSYKERHEYGDTVRRGRADQSVNLHEKQIRYYPALLVGRGRAHEVMTKEAIRNHFETPTQVLQDLGKLLAAGCLIASSRGGPLNC